jgi:hypothetical protein
MIHPLSGCAIKKKLRRHFVLAVFNLKQAAIGKRCNINCNVLIENDVLLEMMLR